MIDPSRPDYADTPASPARASYAYALESGGAPCVSIITPFYNTGAVFHETARSVFRQSLQQWEWLIVNDASTDPAALEVLDQYRRRDPRIRVIDLETNGGPSRARNVAFAAARADYVLQLDSDNLLEPTAAEKWWWFLATHPEVSFVKGYSVGFGAEQYLWTRGFHDGSAFLEANPVDATCLIRRSTHQAVGGYDESIRGGLEDWDFWLRCGSHGLWGTTVHEFLDWYRRRPSHSDRWETWDNDARQRSFHASLRERYPALWNGGFPTVNDPLHLPNSTVPFEVPSANRLAKRARRMLLIAPWLTLGGSDKFNLDLVEQLRRRGWEVTVAASLPGENRWQPLFTSLTPDVFVLPAFLRAVDFPRFLGYLMMSRQPDVVLVSHSELGYQLLPYLRSCAPDAAFTDFCHIEEHGWKNGGYPRLSVEYQDMLDASVVSSEHLKTWMANNGGDASRIAVCYTGVAAAPDDRLARQRTSTRAELGVGADLPVMLYPARLCDQKQPRVLAETARQLDRAGTDFRLVVAGDGPDGEWLARFLHTHHLTQKVQMLGAVSPSRISDLMAAADILFLPSQWEGIALTLYEAMAHGTAIVGADVGGQAELVTSACGVLLPRLGDEQREADAYAAALTPLLTDVSLARRLGAAGHQRVRDRFPLEQMATDMEQAFARAAALHRDEPRVAPPPALARICATQAIEYLRLTRVADELWQWRTRIVPAHSPMPERLPWRTRLVHSFNALEKPYAWAVARGWTWLPTMRARLRAALAP